MRPGGPTRACCRSGSSSIWNCSNGPGGRSGTTNGARSQRNSHRSSSAWAAAVKPNTRAFFFESPTGAWEDGTYVVHAQGFDAGSFRPKVGGRFAFGASVMTPTTLRFRGDAQILKKYLLYRTYSGGAMSPPGAPESQVEQTRVQLGLDEPLVQQYVTYLGDAVRGDLAGEALPFGGDQRADRPVGSVELGQVVDPDDGSAAQRPARLVALDGKKLDRLSIEAVESFLISLNELKPALLPGLSSFRVVG